MIDKMLAALLGVLLFCPFTLAIDASIRGLDPSLAARYAPAKDGSFRCLDGLKNIAYAQVNDNYCDCYDGSDEPGQRLSVIPSRCRRPTHLVLHAARAMLA